MSTLTKTLCAAALAAAALLSPLAARAEYPDRPITLIVPFAAGGPTDAIARLIAKGMSENLKQTIVIENVGGAGGTTGSARAAKAKPDGYTLLIGHAGTHAASVGLYTKLPYDPVTSYEFIGEMGDAPQILVVNKDLPITDLKSFIAYVKAKDTQLNFGTAGVGSASYLGGVMLNSALGTNVPPVHYRGAGPAMNDVIGGQIQYMVDVSTTALPQIRGNTVRPITVLRSQRIASLPDLPATPEEGMPGLDFSVWNVLLAPAGTPRPIIDRLNVALRAALADPTLAARLAELGIELPDEARRSPEGARAHVAAEIQKWVPVVKATGVTLD
ncbi:MAG: tripartite tricarboxylate transporter substrate-binding protein [Pseudomonadota bacterium]